MLEPDNERRLPPPTDGEPSAQNGPDIAALLRDVDWDFADAKTVYFSHGLHPYPAKFIPQIPRALIERLSKPGDLVWDPFGGSGTTALEALLLGRSAISTDLNPVAEVVGRAKTTTLTVDQERSLRYLAQELKSIDPKVIPAADSHLAQRFTPDIPNLDKWFKPSAVAELAYLRARIQELSDEQARYVALACFSKEVFTASNQDSETRYASVERRTIKGHVLRAFARTLITVVHKLQQQAHELRFRTAKFATVDVRQRIVGSNAEHIVGSSTVDLVVTSPPYPNATDYHLYHRFRIFWLGHSPQDVGTAEIGSHLRHQRQKSSFDSYLDEMGMALDNVAAALKPGGYAAFVVGDAVFGGKVFPTAARLGALAQARGFENLTTITRQLPEYKRSFGHAARRLRQEQILLLRKPAARVKLCVYGPTYSMFGYESELFARERAQLLGSMRKASDGSYIAGAVPPAFALPASRLAFASRFTIDTGGPLRSWQAMLENGDAARQAMLRRKDPKYVTHGIHPYKGKFYPQLAKALLNGAGVQPGARIFDPFCGSGTVLLESALNGWNAVGVDINPLAVRVANAKAESLHADPVQRDRALAAFEARLAELCELRRMRASRFPYSPALVEEIHSWFAPKVGKKLAQLLSEIADVADTGTQSLLMVLLSSIIRDVSQQEPKDLRVRRRAEPLDDAPVFQLMAARVKETRDKLRHFASVSHQTPLPFGRAAAYAGDGSAPGLRDTIGIGEGEFVDVVLTSPPYATALPYIDTDRLSLLVCHGLDSSERRSLEDQLIGSREIRGGLRTVLDERIKSGDLESVGSATAAEKIQRIYKLNANSDVGFRRKNMAALLLIYFEKMLRTIQNVTAVTHLGSYAFVIIGDTRTIAGGREVPIRSGKVISEQFQRCGWHTDWVLPITVTKENVLHSRNAVTENEIYCFRRN